MFIQISYTSAYASAQSHQFICILPAEPFYTLRLKEHYLKLSQTKFKNVSFCIILHSALEKLYISCKSSGMIIYIKCQALFTSEK